MNYIQDVIPEVRQAAAYGVGVMAIAAKETYADAIRGDIGNPLLLIYDCFIWYLLVLSFGEVILCSIQIRVANGFSTAAMFLRSCVAQALSRRDESR